MDRNHHSHVEQQTIFSLARRFREGADLAEKDITLRWINKVVASFATMKNAEAKANYPPPPLRSSHLSQGDRVNRNLKGENGKLNRSLRSRLSP